MRIRIQKDEAFSGLTLPVAMWDVAFIGTSSLDDRGKAAITFVKSRSIDQITVSYDPDTFEIQLGGDVVNSDYLDGRMEDYRGKTVLVDATTVGFCEVPLLFRALKTIGASSVTFIYVEPKNYHRNTDSLKRAMREFKLSKEIKGFKYIPGYSNIWSNDQEHHVVFFLGFEAIRFDRALDEFEEMDPQNCTVVFGVPPFQPGMEMDAFHNYLQSRHADDIKNEPNYCGAENPIAAIQFLLKVRNKVLHRNQFLFVVPIGTKPQGIATAIYAAMNPDDVGILYDHPINSPNRSEQIGNWHLYTIEELSDNVLHP